MDNARVKRRIFDIRTDAPVTVRDESQRDITTVRVYGIPNATFVNQENGESVEFNVVLQTWAQHVFQGDFGIKSYKVLEEAEGMYVEILMNSMLCDSQVRDMCTNMKSSILNVLERNTGDMTRSGVVNDRSAEVLRQIGANLQVKPVLPQPPGVAENALHEQIEEQQREIASLSEELASAKHMSEMTSVFQRPNLAEMRRKSAPLLQEDGDTFKRNLQRQQTVGCIVPYRVTTEITLRKHIDMNSDIVGAVKPGTIVTVTETRGRRAKIIDPVKGWVSIKSIDNYHVFLKELQGRDKEAYMKSKKDKLDNLIDIRSDIHDQADYILKLQA